jgi:hypothetical protein
MFATMRSTAVDHGRRTQPDAGACRPLPYTPSQVVRRHGAVLSRAAEDLMEVWGQ